MTVNLPTQERPLIELMPPVQARPLPRRLSPRRRPARMWLRDNGIATGWCLAAAGCGAHAITQLLVGA